MSYKSLEVQQQDWKGNYESLHFNYVDGCMCNLNCRKLRICWFNVFILSKDTNSCLISVFYVNQICALLLRYERFGVVKCQHLICSVKMALVMTWPALLCVRSKIKYALLGARQQHLLYIVSNWVLFFFFASWNPEKQVLLRSHSLLVEL